MSNSKMSNTTNSHKGRNSNSRDAFAEALDGIELFRTPGGMPYAGLDLDGRMTYYPIRDSGFLDVIRIRYLDVAGESPHEASLKREINTLAALAKQRGSEAELHVRMGESDDGAIYVDLGQRNGTFVRITPEGWETVKESPLNFWRNERMAALPSPVEGDLSAVRSFLNLRSEDDYRLAEGFAVAAFLPRPPHFVLILEGPQGSGKTVAAKVLTRLLHPSDVTVRHRPRNEDDLLISARQSPVLAHDNLSVIPKWQSDTYCGLATGTAHSKRQLYTAFEEVAFAVSCRTILTGIADLAQQDDLRERAIILDLPKLDPSQLKDEHEFWREFELARPAILGGLYTAVSAALARRDVVTTPRLPRMTSPARFVTAAEEALGWEHMSFIQACERNRSEAVETVIEYDAVAPYVRELANREGTWIGTATDLLRHLRSLRPSEDRNRTFPDSPAQLGALLPRIAPALEEVGVEVQKTRESGGNRTRLIKISSDGFASAARARKKWKARNRKQSRTNGRPSADQTDSSPTGLTEVLRDWIRRRTGD